MATPFKQPAPGEPTPVGQQMPWWQTTPWWQLQPSLGNPSTWPGIAPVVGTYKGVNGGPNWLPVISPLLSGPVNLNEAVGQGMYGAGASLTKGLTTNPRPQVQPNAQPNSGLNPMDGWTFNVSPQTGGIVGAESNWNPYAKNPRSSAAGLGQFLESTWMDKDLRKRAGFDKIDDKAWAALRSGKAGVPAQVAMTEAYAQRNTEQWEKRFGGVPDQGQLYGMHFLDAQPFMYLTELAAANPNTDVSKTFSKQAAANPEIFFNDPKTRKDPRTAGELYAEITRRGGGNQDPWTFPSLQGVSPEQAMGMIPNPTRPQSFQLPAAPQMGMADPRPMEEMVNSKAALDALKEFAPKDYDPNEGRKGRLATVLTGIAAGAANAGDGWGNILASIGAGAGQAANVWDAETRRDKKATEEAQRLFGLSLARMGIELEEQNRGVRARNADRKWQDSRDKLTTDFANKSSQWEVDMKQYLLNNGLENEYRKDLDQARMLRARVGLSAIEQQAALANEQATGQAGLDLKRFIWENDTGNNPINDKQAKVVSGMLSGIGVDTKLAASLKDGKNLNAAQAAHYIASNNKEAAIASLGREMALTGRYDLIPDEKVRGQIEVLAKQDPEMAASALGRLLNEGEKADPGSALAWAKTLAANGYPVGQLFLRHVKQPTANQPNAAQAAGNGGTANGGTR